MRVNKIATHVANYINKSKNAQKVLKSCSKNPALFFATSSFIIQTTARPALTLMVTPDKADGKFGACSSVSSAIVEMVGSYLIFKPMNKYIEKASKELYNTKGSMFYENPLLLRKFKSITNRFAKIPPTLLTSLVRFSLIGPIAVLLAKFGIQKGCKNEDK